MSTPNTLTPAAAELRTLAQDIVEWADSNDLTQAALLKQHSALGDRDTLRAALAGKSDAPEKWLANYRAVAAVIAPAARKARLIHFTKTSAPRKRCVRSSPASK